MPSLTRRTQLLLDDELHRRLREIATERGISIGALIREAIDEKLASIQDSRSRAFAKLLEAEPMPVEDWPVMKQQILEDRYGKLYEAVRRRTSSACVRRFLFDTSVFVYALGGEHRYREPCRADHERWCSGGCSRQRQAWS